MKRVGAWGWGKRIAIQVIAADLSHEVTAHVHKFQCERRPKPRCACPNVSERLLTRSEPINESFNERQPHYLFPNG